MDIADMVVLTIQAICLIIQWRTLLLFKVLKMRTAYLQSIAIKRMLRKEEWQPLYKGLVDFSYAANLFDLTKWQYKDFFKD
jgi:hypothetical protein